MPNRKIKKEIDSLLEDLSKEYNLAIISVGKKESVTSFLRKRIKKLVKKS